MTQSGVTPEEFSNAVILGLQRWKAASSDLVGFDYWQGIDPTQFPPNSEYNGTSSIYFASNANGDTHLTQNVLGMTQVWYNTESGEILETDIVLNDRNFYFTNNPTDTSGSGANPTTLTQGKPNVYIQNVITHEIGHALGLSHSGGLQSTMLFMESPEQAHLGCDELIGIHALYPTSDLPHRGSLSGKVLTEAGHPIFGAHVLAISRKRGTVLATALTNPKGVYSLEELEPDDYFLMVEPFYAGFQALPNYFAPASASLCPGGTTFGRSFLNQPNNSDLTPIPVEAGKTASAPNLIAHCNSTGGASIFLTPPSGNLSSAPTITAEVGIKNGFGIVDRLYKILPNIYRPNYYHLLHISGHLEVHALSYSLYSPVHTSITLLSQEGRPVQTEVYDPIYSGESGFVNRDAAIVTNGLAPGNYIIQVNAVGMESNDYPAGIVSLDNVPFLILTGSINDALPPLGESIPLNARCKGQETFPHYNSPPGIPPKSQTHLSTPSAGGCGTTQNDRSRFRASNSRDLTGTSPYTLLGWILPWLVMSAMNRAAIHLHARRPRATLSK